MPKKLKRVRSADPPKKTKKQKTWIEKADEKLLQEKETITTPAEGRKPGRPAGSKNKDALIDLPKVVQKGLLHMFTRSRAPRLLLAMMNMQLPPIYKSIFGDRPLSRKEQLQVAKIIERNFKWSVELVQRALPKSLGIFGTVVHEHTLTGMVKRAITAPKSKKVLDMVAKQTEEGILEYQAAETEEKE